MPNPRVLGGGEDAFRAILARIESATRRIEMHAFLWHDDDTGNQLGRAVLRAADRGVKVHIRKDRVAAVYEHSGGNGQSFFHKRIRPAERFQAWVLGAAYRRPADQRRPSRALRRRQQRRPRQRPNPLVVDLLAHPNVVIDHQRKRFDHSKLFIFDDECLILGSMGIGDEHRNEWLDIMIELEGAEHVLRLRQRMAGTVEFDRSRGIDFLVHNRAAHARKTCPMLAQRLALIDSARESLVVKMAYLGDPRFTDAMARAVDRGVRVTLLTGENPNVLQQLNRRTCAELLRRTGAPDHLKVVLHPRMVHSKLVVIDDRYCDVGSANFTRLSHGVYDEVNLYVDDPRFAAELRDHALAHCEDGQVVQGMVSYRKFASQIERATVAFQARHGA
ncbi:MAG: phosphatidylserine/phosphatidylglycerophosphate/cardiolipin synthase family protein [Deltaproteobacteria bacterium]|nr:MAG: phosphatidylserine/phosphatidylglycerophosphate/cardiolipin synthase family protein [Deltaproteobacteria bacterium]